MPLLSLKWNPNCVLSVVGNSTFATTNAKRDVTIITLSTEDNAKLSKLLSQGFIVQFIGTHTM